MNGFHRTKIGDLGHNITHFGTARLTRGTFTTAILNGSFVGTIMTFLD